MEQLNPQANSKIGGRGEMSRSSSVPGARVGPRSLRMEVSRVWPNSAKVGNGDRGGVTGGRSGCGDARGHFALWAARMLHTAKTMTSIDLLV